MVFASSSPPSFSPAELQSLFAGVIGLCEDTQFTICFHSPPEAIDTGKGGARAEGMCSTVRQPFRLTCPLSSPCWSTTSQPGGGHVLRSSTGGSSANGGGEGRGDKDEESSTAIPPGHEKCSYCGSVMPSCRLLMHKQHCAQSTFKCPFCK